MGAFRVPIEVGAFAGERLDRFEALVDTGATYTSIPKDRLRQLGVQPDERWPFILADGSELNYDIAWVRLRMGGRTQPTIAVFGDPGSEPLLGVVTLEEFRLAVDPVRRRLLPVPALLKNLAPL